MGDKYVKSIKRKIYSLNFFNKTFKKTYSPCKEIGVTSINNYGIFTHEQQMLLDEDNDQQILIDENDDQQMLINDEQNIFSFKIIKRPYKVIRFMGNGDDEVFI
ncbi:hypothetical protein [Tanapox virus]|uniref:Uncharacterized protein 22L n=1 Tax=Tanapox virus TaxID=99000 RepID=A7XCC7_9POXV|nr:hypothetical protein [Tanapox virus]ABQ43649.1 hypothetical protein [Tanapox virus]